jgi:hypothetical protein
MPSLMSLWCRLRRKDNGPGFPACRRAEAHGGASYRRPVFESVARPPALLDVPDCSNYHRREHSFP